MPKPKITIKGEIVLEALQQFPETPTQTLAKMIYRDNKKIFLHQESVRGLIRYYRGQSGKSHRKYIANKEHLSKPGSISPFEALPKGIESLETPKFRVLKHEKSLVISDLHIQCHNEQALFAALEYGYKNKVNAVIILGDLNDFYGISTFNKNPYERDLLNELQVTHKILAIMRKGFPNSRIYIKQGNHEDRLRRFYMVKCPELLGIPYFDYKFLLGCDKHKIDLIDSSTIVKIGNLNLLHGHEFGRSFGSAVSPARSLYLKTKSNCLQAHHHRASEYSERDLNGNKVTCYSIGCMCSLRPDWKPINQWEHGFALVELIDSETGDFAVQNKTIQNGRVF